jgi:hypothetical protein
MARGSDLDHERSAGSAKTFGVPRTSDLDPTPPCRRATSTQTSRAAAAALEYIVGVPVFRISDPTVLSDLVEELAARHDCLAEVIGPNRLSVSVLGSYNNDALELEVELRVRAWQAVRSSHDVEVDVVIDRCA